MDKEWAQLRLCLAECRNQLPTLRPTASSSQPDQRLRGQTKIYLFLPPLALVGWGWSLIRPEHTHTPPPPEKGCCLLYCPGCLGNAGGPVTLSGFCRICLPHRTWPRLILRFICIPHAPAWQMVGEEAGCVLGAAAGDQAEPRGPQQSAHPPCPMGQAQAGATPNAGVPTSASQPLRSAGCWDLTFDFSKD